MRMVDGLASSMILLDAVKRVLICDDEPPMRELARAVLDDGYEFGEAADGLECIADARRVPPDLMLIDLMLPGISGLELLAELRADPALAGVPVVVMSAWNHLEREALAAGAARFFGKPFEPEELRRAVNELLAER
jgi:two-component system, OmpR family, response regulator